MVSEFVGRFVNTPHNKFWIEKMGNLRRLAFYLATITLISACGGGSQTGDGTTVTTPPADTNDPFKTPNVAGTAPAQYTIKGIVSVAETAEVDADTNDPQASYKGNDRPSTAQVINNPSLLVGHLTFPNQGPAGPNRDQGDLIDVYKVRLTAGQVVELEFAASPSDIDIDLFVRKATSVTTAGPIVGQSVGENRYECIRIATTADYFISAEVYEPSSIGDTVYQLRISAPGATATCANSTSDGGSQIIPARILAKPITESAASADTSSPSASSANPTHLGAVLKSLKSSAISARQLSPEIADRVGPTLYEMPSTSLERGVALGLITKSALQKKSVAATAVAYSSERDATLDSQSLSILQTIAYAKAMKRSGEFAYAFPDFKVQSFQTSTPVGSFPPNDRDYSRQRWHYEMISLPAAMNTLQAMAAQPTRRPIVAVIDTGIVSNHPDLVGNIIAGYDFISDVNTSDDGNGIDANPDDASKASSTPSFHGSHVAGTIAAVTFNGIGGAGVAPMARIMPLRALGEGGGKFSDIVQSILFAAGLPNDSRTVPPVRADVINMSLGGAQACPSELRDIFDRVRAQGTLIVAAAGNESDETTFTPVGVPANCAGVISVAAVNATRGRAFYSNVGAENAIAAPGGDIRKSTTGTGDPDGIYSTVASFQNGVRSATYAHLMGTSMATPHVAGVIALMRWVNPNLTVAQIDALIRGGTISDDLGAVGKDSQFGAGLINAKRAVDAALASLGTGVVVAPVPAAGQIEPSPASVSFGATRTEAELVLRRVGTTTDRVVSVTSTLTGVTVAPKAGAVDANGLGTYVLTLNRSQLTLGAAAFAQVTVTTTTKVIGIPVSADRRATGSAIGTYGPVYIVAFDADDPNGGGVAETSVVNPLNGEYSYSLTVGSAGAPAPGRILIYAGGDTDNDEFICSRGEACGAFPVLGNGVEVIQPRSAVVSGINFSVTPFGGINVTTAALGVKAARANSGLARYKPSVYLSKVVLDQADFQKSPAISLSK
jgi:serine protease